MNGLKWGNLAGVVCLALLCGAQWSDHRVLEGRLRASQEAERAQAARLVEREIAGRALASDLTDFKEQYRRAAAEAQQAHASLSEARASLAAVTDERDQLRAGMARWTEAVEMRDARLKDAEQRIREAGRQWSNAVWRYNGLASNHNAVVFELNAVRARGTNTPTQPPR